MPAWFLLAVAVPIDHVAATVDDHVIWESLVADRVADQQVARAQALEDLIGDQLLVAEAQREYIQVDAADVAAGLAQIEADNHLDDAGLARALADRGETLDQYRAEMRDQIAELRLVHQSGEPRAQLVGELRAHARVVLAPVAAIQPTAAVHGDVAAVTVTGGAPAQRTGATAATSRLVGAALDRRRLREALDAAMADPTIEGAEVTATQRGGGGVDVAIAVTGRPTLVGVEVRVAGGDPLAPDAALTAGVGRPLSPPVFDHARAHLVTDYADRGYLHATASWRTVAKGAGVWAIVEIVPGDRVRFGTIRLRGNHDLGDAELAHAIAADLAAGQPWNQDAVERASLLLAAYYWDHGYAQVRVDVDPVPATAAGETAIGFTIQEGGRFHLGAITAPALGPAAAGRALAQLAIRSGALFSRTALADARTKLEALAAAQLGYPVDITVLTKVDATTSTVDVTFEIKRK